MPPTEALPAPLRPITDESLVGGDAYARSPGASGMGALVQPALPALRVAPRHAARAWVSEWAVEQGGGSGSPPTRERVQRDQGDLAPPDVLMEAVAPDTLKMGTASTGVTCVTVRGLCKGASGPNKRACLLGSCYRAGSRDAERHPSSNRSSKVAAPPIVAGCFLKAGVGGRRQSVMALTATLSSPGGPSSRRRPGAAGRRRAP